MKPEKQYSQLGYEERQTIAVGKEQGLSIRAIARILKRAPSTISREITRNGGGGAYSCRFAHQRHARKRRHSRPTPKLMVDNALFKSVQPLLQQRWSPQQIAGHLAKLHPQEAAKRISHETIYNVIYAQPRGELRRAAYRLLALGTHQALAPFKRRGSPRPDGRSVEYSCAPARD